MRHDAHGRRTRTVFHKILFGSHDIYFIRCGSHLPVPLGLHFPSITLVRVRGNAPLHRDPPSGLFLSLEERGVGLESPSHTPGPRFVTETSDLEKNQAIARIRAWQPNAISGLISFRGE